MARRNRGLTKLLPRSQTKLARAQSHVAGLLQTGLLVLKSVHRSLLRLLIVGRVILCCSASLLLKHVALKFSALNAFSATAKGSRANGLRRNTGFRNATLTSNLTEGGLRCRLLVRVHVVIDGIRVVALRPRKTRCCADVRRTDGTLRPTGNSTNSLLTIHGETGIQAPSLLIGRTRLFKIGAVGADSLLSHANSLLLFGGQASNLISWKVYRDVSAFLGQLKKAKLIGFNLGGFPNNLFLNGCLSHVRPSFPTGS